MMKRWILIALLLIALVACSDPRVQAPAIAPVGVGGDAPDVVAERFFLDLAQALRDPTLADESRREHWVERLASYFAPHERTDQRIILNDALATLAAGRAELDPDQSLSLDLQFDDVAVIESGDDRAMVQVVNGAIVMLIIRSTDRGQIVEYEQTVGLDAIIGNPDSAVPTVRVGDQWFLSEG